MKKNILLFVGIAGMLLGAPLADAQAKVNVHVGIESTASHSRGNHHQRHFHKKSHRHVVVSKRHHGTRLRHHDARHEHGVKN